MKVVNIILSIALLISFYRSNAQDQELWNFSFEDVKLEEAFARIASETEITLSYNPAWMSTTDRITSDFKDMEVTEILGSLVSDELNVIRRGKYVIIQKQKKQSGGKVELAGQLLDAETGKEITDASVIDLNTLTASLTGNKGQYQLRVSSKYEDVGYLITKKDYKDTLIFLPKGQGIPPTISLTKSSATNQKEEEIDRSKFFKAVIGNRIQRHLQNVTLGDERPFHLSLFPGASTNGLLAGKIINNVSINASVGLAYGVKGLDLSGAASIIRGDVKGSQISGAVNYVGGKMNGLQLAGAINSNFDRGKGVQGAGAINVNRGDFAGFQFAGAANNVTNFKGFQLAGAGNWSDQFKGFQLAGALNYTHGTIKGVQVSGAVNYVKDELSGLQLSGFLNYAYTLSGVQIGVVNIVNEDKGGFSFGLLNIIKGGLKKVEFSTNDVTPFNLSFRMGTSRLYNVYQVGIQPWSGEHWNYGLGLGTHFNFSKQYFGNVELLYLEVRSLSDASRDNFNLAKFQLNIGYQIAPQLSLVGGPVLNLAIRQESNETFGIEPNWLLIENQDISMWLGYRVAVRF